MPITPADKHRVILGKEPTPTQLELYTRYPAYRGFSDRTLNAEKLEAVILLALVSGGINERVLCCAPVAHENWVVAQFNEVATTAFNHCKTLPNKLVIANAYAKLFSKVAIIGRLLQITDEPSHWVSFGFSKDDPLPEWMPKRLIDQPSSSSSLTI